MSKEAGQLEKNIFRKVGKNFHTYFYVLCSFSHNFRASLAHTRKAVYDNQKKIACCINAMLFFMLSVPCMRCALSLNAYTHSRLSRLEQRYTNTRADRAHEVSRCSARTAEYYFHSHLDISVLVGLSPKAVLFRLLARLKRL